VELIKYYPSSQTIHIQQEGRATLCGRTAPYEVITQTTDRLGMVSCTDCRAVYMAKIKAERNGKMPAVSPGEEDLAGLLQALTLAVKALTAVVEKFAHGSR
jgi:hypothetical protein